MSRKKVLVNAIPLTYIHTGISRYLSGLYCEMEKRHADLFQYFYFNGQQISASMPTTVASSASWSKLGSLFWRLPSCFALAVRLVVHSWHERMFNRLSNGFDLYHEAGFVPFRSSLPVVFTVHDLSLVRFPDTHPKERVLFFRLFFKKRLTLAHKIIAVSNFTRQELATWSGLSPADIAVTPLGYERSLFYPMNRQDVVSFLEKKGLPDKFFLFVGSGDPRKNLAMIPQACLEAGLRYPLLVAGWSGWQAPGSTVHMEYPVTLLNYVSDQELSLLYNGALALVFPSSYEGFGLPVLEAMACACPVVVSSRASLPEVAGSAGMYFELEQGVSALGACLREIAMDHARRSALSFQGIEQAKRFSWSRTADLTAQVFDSLF